MSKDLKPLLRRVRKFNIYNTASVRKLISILQKALDNATILDFHVAMLTVPTVKRRHANPPKEFKPKVHITITYSSGKKFSVTKPIIPDQRSVRSNN